MAQPKITLYYDVVSPFSRCAYYVLRRYQKPWNLDLQCEPINLGYVMKYAENRPPIAVPNKGRWMDQDMVRSVKFFDVPLNRPANFPVNTFFAQSLLRLIKLESPNEHLPSLETLYDATWTNDQPVDKPEHLAKLLGGPSGVFKDEEKLQALIEKAFTKEAKGALSQEAKELVEEGGCFGAPWIVVKRPSDGATERFFGSDRFEVIAAFLGLPYMGPMGDNSQPKL